MLRRSSSNRRKKSTRRRSKRKTKTSWLRRLLFQTGLIACLALAVYTAYLDYVVQREFAGKRWAIPARVYGRPLELYPGAAVNADQLVDELKRLGYRKVTHPRQAGSYSRNRSRFLVWIRPFVFWDGEAAGQLLDIRFSSDRLASLRTGAGKKLSLVRLEAPAVGSIYPSHNEDRVLVSRTDLPEKLIQALVAVEDRSFYRHFGVDARAIARATWVNLRAGGVVQGGSTLTQQLVKNFFLAPERSLWRKANEALMALLLERRYAKDEILEAYANEIYLGQDGKRAVHGFGLASQFYFKRPLQELDIPRLALLVALVKGPSYYAPRRHPERAKKRRDLVLNIMQEQGILTPDQARRATQTGLGITATKGHSAGRFPAFMDLVRRQLHRDYRQEDLTSEGLRIFTTLDPWIQQRAEQVLADQLKQLEQGQKRTGALQGAAVIASSESGEVLAVVGGRYSGFAGFNRALDAVRPIGSLVKPAVYLAALKQPARYTLLSRLEDAPVQIKSSNGDIWAPQNYDKKSHGAVALHTSLAKSYNLSTVRLGMAVGLDEVVSTLHDLGVRRPMNPYPSLLLGAVSLSPLEVTQMYQTLAAGGFYSPLRAIREVHTAEGEQLQRYPLIVQQAAPTGPVFLLNKVLQEVVQQGTGRSLSRYISPEMGLAGKTGTTDDLRDSWFAGFSGDKVAVVWVGRDDNKSAGLSGSSGALRVWGNIMRRIRPMALDLLLPESVENVWTDPASGLRADSSCAEAVQVPFIVGSAPSIQSSCAAEQDSSFIGDLLKAWFK
ncbi:Multimodular transpeptidase-transglycosylase [hydrothermal vent metagenome]|uniref:Penicillin-binding protein 1B n=1 Tax=hydrothermal vent metagenome TaxID=652676 RepID=A0A3B1B546_9ZZZZ